MKKEVILILIILLFTTATYAVCDVTDTLDKGSSKTYVIDGRDHNITFSSLKNDSDGTSVKFKINGVSTPDLEEGKKHTFNDLSDITILSISIGNTSVNSTAEICFNAGLVGSGQGTCTSNADCDNNNSCTIDECDGDPLRCHHKLILWCRDNDGCCQESRCTYEEDNDCPKLILDECINNSDCDDNDPSTKDICNETTKKCDNAKIIVCTSEDDYCPENCTFVSDTDCDECSINIDCDDNNACTSDSCLGFPKRCFNNATIGCNFNETCISVGTRTGYYFCNTYNALESLKSKKEYCDNDYECLSNQCIKNKCKGLPFVKAITNWLRKLFGG